MADKVTQDEIIAALRKTKGMKTIAAKELRIAYNTLVKYIGRSPVLQAVLSEERESMLDGAELKLYTKAVIEGDTASLIFLLKTQGKSRGYVERQEVTGADGAPQQMTIAIVGLLPDEDS